MRACDICCLLCAELVTSASTYVICHFCVYCVRSASISCAYWKLCIFFLYACFVRLEFVFCVGVIWDLSSLCLFPCVLCTIWYVHGYISFHEYMCAYRCVMTCKDRRKFKSQTSKNMDRWSSRGGQSQTRETKKKENQRRDRVRKKRKSRLAKTAVRSHLVRWEIKNGIPLWREADLKVKTLEKPHSWSALGSWDVQKVYAVVANSTYQSKNDESTACSDHFWNLRCSKSARSCGAKHISKSKCSRHTMHVRTTFGSCNVQKIHAVEAKQISKSKCQKHTTFGQFVAQKCYNTEGLRPFLGVEMWKKRASRWRETHHNNDEKPTSKSKCWEHTTSGLLLDGELSRGKVDGWMAGWMDGWMGR